MKKKICWTPQSVILCSNYSHSLQTKEQSEIIHGSIINGIESKIINHSPLYHKDFRLDLGLAAKDENDLRLDLEFVQKDFKVALQNNKSSLSHYSYVEIEKVYFSVSFSG